MTPGTRPRSRRGEGGQLRDEILAAANRLLVATGDEEAVSVRAIADEVGCTAPAIYLHFADKDELIQAVCERHFAQLDAEVVAAGEVSTSPVEALRRGAHAYVRFGVENPEHYRIIFMHRSEALAPPDLGGETAGGRAFRHLVEQVQQCMDAGAFAPGDADEVATVLWAVVHGVTALAIAVPGFPFRDLADLTDRVLDVQCRGLAG